MNTDTALGNTVGEIKAKLSGNGTASYLSTLGGFVISRVVKVVDEGFIFSINNARQ